MITLMVIGIILLVVAIVLQALPVITFVCCALLAAHLIKRIIWIVTSRPKNEEGR